MCEDITLKISVWFISGRINQHDCLCGTEMKGQSPSIHDRDYKSTIQLEENISLSQTAVD